jgi:ABC-2 type transport system ATP-binding protein
MSVPALAVRGLTKHYGDRAAVDAIDLTVAPGDVYGFLGPNGAGKTTTLRMLLGLVEEPRLYTSLRGRANLELLADYGLTTRAGDEVGHYSQGMRQRLGIAACLVRRPRLLILDEPANGVDPGGVRDLRALLRRLSDEASPSC